MAVMSLSDILLLDQHHICGPSLTTVSILQSMTVSHSVYPFIHAQKFGWFLFFIFSIFLMLSIHVYLKDSKNTDIFNDHTLKHFQFSYTKEYTTPKPGNCNCGFFATIVEVIDHTSVL